MSESSLRTIKWPYVALAGVCLVVGVDLGVRLGSRGVTAPPPASSPEARPQAAAPSPPPPRPRPLDGEVRAEEPTRPEAPPKPDKPREKAAPPIQMPPPSPRVAELMRAADEARAGGDPAGAVEKLKEAEAAADEPARKEDLALRRLWLLYEMGQLDEVRRIAEPIALHAVTEQNQQVAAEVLAKLGTKKR